MKTKSCELDILPTFKLKELIEDFQPIITKIVNLSLAEGKFPSDWKNARIRPLIKKMGMDLTTKSYRPVSNLPFLAKVIESVALDQMNAHCDEHKVIPDYQSAYCANYSCETALVKLVNDILWCFERQEGLQTVACDLSAAFDTVDHCLLIEVLQKIAGLGGSVISWCQSYLESRTCQVTVGAAVSNKKDLLFSVPQGSLVGPWFYLIYALTLQDVLDDSDSGEMENQDKLGCPITLSGFADDHIFKDKFKLKDKHDEIECKMGLEKCAKRVKSWMDSNRLKMNDDKTEYIVFSSSRMLTHIECDSININGISIPRSECIRYLGAWLDQQLSLRKHIMLKCRTAMMNLQRLKMIRKYLTEETAKVLVLGLVLSHLDYLNAIFVGLPDKDIKAMQRVQNAAAKMVLLKTKYDSSTDALKRLHWLPIRYRVEHKMLTLVYKCLHDKAPDYLKNLLTVIGDSERSMRSNSQYMRLLIPKTTKKTFAARSFSVKGAELWNNLPNSVKISSSVNDFKAKLKTFLFTKAYTDN